ncbi:MAG TPA: alpha/beta hydrolase [Solirubrobacteraceae bacterium]|nr:alpha/beta hydrolase [Solirubrobacteraceae bacterium]
MPTRAGCARALTAVLAVLLLAVVWSVPASTSAVGRVPDGAGKTSVAHPCRGMSRVLCGAVRVPLYWSRPGGSKLTVHFRVYLRTDSAAPALEPIVAMEGGPGYPSIGSAGGYLFMIGSLRRRHDLIVMDNRGTGTSGAINCPRLQRYDALARPGNIAAVVRDCATRLGAAANAYGTDAVGDDLAYILRRLGVHRVDVYGDSYGDYSAQVFTLHHPGLVRAMILDGSYYNAYNPFETEASAALRRAWTLLCRRSTGCGTRPILAQLAAFDRRLRRHPVVGVSRDADGARERVDLTAAAFAQLVFDATYYYSTFIDLPAALRAFDAGDRAPLLRLAAEDVAANAGGGAPSGYSAGDLMVVSCHDYPTVWRTSAAPAQRRAELSHAISSLGSNVFAPFSKSVYLRSYDENELVDGCLDWPTPQVPDPPFPAGTSFPHTPVLIFDGQFDQATPLADARKVSAAWQNSTLVEVANANHVTADGDMDHCTSVILQRFIRTLSAGNTSCAGAMPPIAVRPDFPTHLTDAPAARPVAGNRASALGRKAGWVAAQTVGDALTRWFNLMESDTGHGLYGGSFTVGGGAYYSYEPIKLTLHGCRLVKDLAVSGTVVWQRSAGRVRATVVTRGPSGSLGRLTLRWGTGVGNARSPATVTGSVDGAAARVELPAPWVPQS